jgi:hypothetical protein
MEFITSSDIFSIIYKHLDVNDITSLYTSCKGIKEVIKEDRDIIYEKVYT